MAFRLTITDLLNAVRCNRVDVIESSLKLYGMPKSEEKITDYFILQIALGKNQLKIAKLLINAGCRVEAMSSDHGFTPLYLAFMHDEPGIAFMILKKCTTIYLDNSRKSTVLHLAVQRKSLRMLRLMFLCNNLNLNVNVVDADRKTALQIVLENCYSQNYYNQIAKTNEIEMIRFLLSKGASVNFKSDNGQTALHYAVVLKQEDIINTILQRIPDVNLCNNLRETALHVLLKTSESEDDIFEIMKSFIQKGANFDIGDSQKITIGHLAAEKKYFKIMDMVLQYQHSFNLQDRKGNTILHKMLENSAHFSNTKISMYFVDDVILSLTPLENYQNSLGKTLLHLAAENYQYEILKKMLSKTKNLNITDNNGNSLLHILLRNASIKNYEIIENLLKSGANVDSKNKEGVTPLHLALKEENIKLLLKIIENSKNLNQHNNEQKQSLLHSLLEVKVSSQSEQLEIAKIAKICIERGATVDLPDFLSRTPLFLAALNQRTYMVKILLEHGADANIPVMPHKSIIANLIRKPILTHIDLEIADMLMIKGADVDIDFNGWLALMNHIYLVENRILLIKLLKNSKNVNVSDDVSGNTLLHVLVRSIINTDHTNQMIILEVVNLLVSKNVSVDVKNEIGVTALHLAARNKYDLVSKFLLENGANVTMLDNTGNSVMHFVSMLDFDTDDNVEKNLIDLFLAKGCNINSRNKFGMTPLLTAAKSGCAKVIRALLNHGAEMKYTVDENLSNPLHIAAQYNQDSVIEQLLKCGVDIYAVRKDGKTALHVAAVYGKLKALMALLRSRADPDVRDVDGRSALHWACWYDNLDIVNLLLARGADVNALDKFQNTPLMLAQISNNAVWRKLQLYITKLKTAGISIAKQNIDCINNYKKKVNTVQFCNVAQLEILMMKKVLINNGITLADVLLMKSDRLAVFISNGAFKNFIISDDFDKKFPLYFSMIKACYYRGSVRKNLSTTAKAGLRQMLGLSLPDTCIELIFQYLDNQSLIKLTQAAKMKIIIKQKRICIKTEVCVRSKRVCCTNE